jgi:ABC-2 type transport system permease protein
MSSAPITQSAIYISTFKRDLHIFLREARYEFIRLLRTRSFALSIIGFPVVFYIFFGLVMNRGGI